jgi:predicted transcriptional regulator
MKNISNNEWRILDALWRLGEASAREVHSALAPFKAITTIQTYLERMAEKGVVLKRKLGANNLYRAAHPREEVLRRSVKSFVDQTFNGSYSSFLNLLLDMKGITAEELDEIRSLLEEREARS